MKEYKLNAYQKTESVLKNYNRIKKSLSILESELTDLEKEKEKISQSIAKPEKVVLKDSDKNYYYTDETLENRINELKQLAIKVQAEIKFIDDCLKEIEHDEYYKIIPKLYFERKTIERIAEELDTSTQTIYFNKKRLLHELSYLIVPLDKLTEIKKIA